MEHFFNFQQLWHISVHKNFQYETMIMYHKMFSGIIDII